MVDYAEDVNFVPQGSLEIGLYMMPAYEHGYSPLSVALEIHCSPGYGIHEVIEYAINFGDGSEIVKGTFDKPAFDGIKIATVPHTFIYSKAPLSKYTGRTFYPDVTVKSRSGAVKSLNQRGRKACEIWCKDSRFD